MSSHRSEKLHSPLLFTRLTLELTYSLIKINMIIRMIRKDVDQTHRAFMMTILYSKNRDIDWHAIISRFETCKSNALTFLFDKSSNYVVYRAILQSKNIVTRDDKWCRPTLVLSHLYFSSHVDDVLSSCASSLYTPRLLRTNGQCRRFARPQR